MSDRFPIDCNGKTVHMSLLTAGVKRQFVNWLKSQMMLDAQQWMDPLTYKSFLMSLATDPRADSDKDTTLFWSALPSEPVAKSLSTQAGTIKLNRLLFGADVAHLNDDQLWTWLKAKDVDGSDYEIAWQLVFAEAHPKANPQPKGESQTQLSDTSASQTDMPNSPAP
jgi:hypothetical protein